MFTCKALQFLHNAITSNIPADTKMVETRYHMTTVHSKVTQNVFEIAYTCLFDKRLLVFNQKSAMEKIKTGLLIANFFTKMHKTKSS